MNELSGRSRAWLLALWIGVLLLLGVFVMQQLRIGADLRLFLPSPRTAQERLLLEEIGEGPGSRVLVVAIGGAPPEQLADASRTLRSALSEDSRFRFVANGDVSLDDMPDALLPYRYLLSTTLDEQAFDAEYLGREIHARARDLASPAGSFLEPLLPRDPTLEILAVLQRWQPAQEPNRLYDVWFDRAGAQALLLAETAAPAFDPDGQRIALEALQSAFDSIESVTPLSLTISGAGRFSVLMQQRTRTEAQLLSAIASGGLILILLLAYRSASAIAFSALPLASAALAGMASVTALFGTVHGITLAFGFTLIGVAQDYPVHLLSHRQLERDALRVARGLWPTLATGVVSTCIAYLTFFFSGVEGLQQLATFTIAGLATASLTTRFLLPRLMGKPQRASGSQRLERIVRWIDALPHPRWVLPMLTCVALAAIALDRTPLWENDLSKLTPVPHALIEQDQRLRGALGAADARYLLVLHAPEAQQALQRLEELDARLEGLVRDGAIGNFDHAARYIPSIRRQLVRRARLPSAGTLRAALAEAQAGTPFRTGVFEPFLRDVQQARTAPALKPEDLHGTSLGATLEMLLSEAATEARALVTLHAVRDTAALRAFTAAHDDLLLLDLKAASESLVARQRTHLLWSLLFAALLLVAVIALALRSRVRVLRVVAPMALTTVFVIAILQTGGVSLTLFHLIALMLAAGLGLDYALFFEHAGGGAAEKQRTLHAILVCALSTLLVFSLLATSRLPVLQAIGVTVALGVIGNFVLALLLAGGHRGAGRHALGTDPHQDARETSSLSQQAGEPLQSVPPPVSSDRQAVPAQPDIPALIPHSGAMCLLERVVDWDDSSLRAIASSHRSQNNPLRVDGRLRSVHLCEYGAQAMAVHGALKSLAAGKQASPGMLVSLRSVTFTRDFIHDLPGDLVVETHCLQASDSSLQYEFKISHRDESLAAGRAAVVLRAES